ncbi:MAG: cell division protein ZapA [Bacteroidetes bacterium]|nr:cell division protein ZapA [Bacteroidota bacterium]MDA0944352.1 cell division protein ZapA [Bacteroidota bacterium]MDA1112639.1 cell division protein ZapA [Bacteroidota bacterium]
MTTENSLLISVNIDDRILRLRVAPKDEQAVRMSAQLLNRRIDAFRSFQATEPIDRLSWAALDMAGDVLKQQRDNEKTAPAVEEELKALEQLLAGV